MSVSRETSKRNKNDKEVIAVSGTTQTPTPDQGE